MITEVKLSNFRGFRSFTAQGIRRINLLVGINNSGKTSVLEALLLLYSGGDPMAIWSSMSRRGEQIFEEERPRHRVELDIAHLFYGHELGLHVGFRLEVKEGEGVRWLSYKVAEKTAEEQPRLLFPLEEAGDLRLGRMALCLDGDPKPAPKAFPLSARGGLLPDVIERLPRPEGPMFAGPPIQFIPSGSVSSGFVVRAWRDVALRPEQNDIVKALRILEPRLEDITVIGAERHVYGPSLDRAGVIVKCSGSSVPVPIGSLGEGMWRMLALAMGLARARGGFLLIDEIDTGFHYTVMADMWRMVAETAEKLGVQVFATTHSGDCVASLAAICRRRPHGAEEVSILRIDRQSGEATSFTEAEIIQAAENRIEIR